MFSSDQQPDSIALYPVTSQNWASVQTQLTEREKAWVSINDFNAKAGQVCLLPNSQGKLAKVVAGYDLEDGFMWAIAGLPRSLPKGNYHLVSEWSQAQILQAAIGWGLGCYQFTEFTAAEAKVPPQLFIGQDLARVNAFVEAVKLVRDLINRPANHMMPEHLAAATQQLADTYQASVKQIIGEALIQQNFPMIYAVGQASVHAPQLIELVWGDKTHPALTLVGKGVCFDTGGLDIKSAFYMRQMKKDMGGAAHVLGLAKLIMQLNLPLYLRVLIPAVDNAISGNAFRPGDIVATRAGKHVEIDNTDAEGRLVLGDALSLAVEQNPSVVIDFATLTGAARTALGTEVPVFFSNNQPLAQQLQQSSAQTEELIWQLPLHKPYLHNLKSKVADLANSGGSYGGAIVAALYLNEFIPETIPWVHFDIMAWNNRERPGRPIGGEAMGLFAVFAYLEHYFLT